MENPNKDYFIDIYPDHWLSSQLLRAGDKTHYRYQEISLDELKSFPGCSILEFGGGSGELLYRIAKKCPEILLFGVDLGRKSLYHAQKTISEKNSNATNFIEGDIISLPLADNSFDRVLASSVLWYVLEPHNAIHEMIRVLKPGGRFVFDVRNPFHITNLLSRLTLFFRRRKITHTPYYSFFSPNSISSMLWEMPIKFEITGYFVFLPTRLPILGRKWGNWISVSQWLSYKAGNGKGQWLSQKLLITGEKYKT